MRQLTMSELCPWLVHQIVDALGVEGVKLRSLIIGGHWQHEEIEWGDEEVGPFVAALGRLPTSLQRLDLVLDLIYGPDFADTYMQKARFLGAVVRLVADRVGSGAWAQLRQVGLETRWGVDSLALALPPSCRTDLRALVRDVDALERLARTTGLAIHCRASRMPRLS